MLHFFIGIILYINRRVVNKQKDVWDNAGVVYSLGIADIMLCFILIGIFDE
jgi:hypothetical protein